MELAGTISYNILAFIFVISIIVFIHEFGHYIVAKVSGVRIETFSIGFGREIFGLNDKSGTRWKVCWIPAGGYVKMFGDIGPSSAPDKKKLKKLTKKETAVAFHTKPLWIKSAIVSAGPIANFLLAIVLITGVYYIDGKPSTLPVASEIMPGSAAMEAGILPGDIIEQMDGVPMESFADIQRYVGLNTGDPIHVKLKRGNGNLVTLVTPKFHTRKDIFGDDAKIPLIGIRSQVQSIDKLDFFPALGEATIETYNIAASTFTAIGQMVTGSRDPTQISGPIGIAKYSGQSARKGPSTVLWFIVVLSVNLGLINLFPIPALDGGHLLYYAIEALKGEPLADKYQEFGLKIGIGFILVLVVLALINDILKLI